MPATKVQLIGGNFQDNEGNVLVNGYLRLRLSSDEVITGVGQIAAGIVTQINLNSSGSVDTSTPQLVWGNDQMTPANSFYIVTGYKANGQLAWGPNNEQVIGSGGTFDTGTWIPNVVISWTYPAAFGPTGPTGAAGSGLTLPTFKTNSVNNADQTVFNVEDTPTVAWSNPSGGVVKATVTPSAINALVNNRVWKAIPNSGALAPAIGLSPNLTSSGSSLTSATATQTNFNTMTTSAAGGDISTVCFSGITGSGINPNVFQIWSTQTLKAVKWQAALVDTANVRVWIALCDLFSGNTGSLVSDTPALHLIGFRYSTAAGDTTWKAVCTNSATQTTVDTGVAVDTLGHSFGIAVSQSSISFQIDDVTVATITTNIPANTVRFGDVISVDNVGLTNNKTVAYAAFATAE